MDFSLSSEHEILRESVRSFAEHEIQPVARELDEKEEFSYDTMQKMAELGANAAAEKAAQYATHNTELEERVRAFAA